NRAEEADKRTSTRGSREKRQVALELGLLAQSRSPDSPVENLVTQRHRGRHLDRWGCHRWVSTQMGDFVEYHQVHAGKKAVPVPERYVGKFARRRGLLEETVKLGVLPAGATISKILIGDDGPGNNREKEENYENAFGNGTRSRNNVQNRTVPSLSLQQHCCQPNLQPESSLFFLPPDKVNI